jgi:S-adenosylmethionine:tRNA ribosyltransferase-isomerase
MSTRSRRASRSKDPDDRLDAGCRRRLIVILLEPALARMRGAGFALPGTAFMRVDLFDFDLPDERIALRPAEPRDSARLLVVDPTVRRLSGSPASAICRSFLRAGRCARLQRHEGHSGAARRHPHREGAGGQQVSATLHMRIGASRWKAFAKPGKRIKIGDRISLRP